MSKPIVWFEVMGKDGDALRRYYAELFGWRYDDAPGDPSYGMVPCQEGSIPGGVGAAPKGPGWTTFYVGVDDLDAAVTQAVQLGGSVLLPRQDMPDLSIAVIADPEGHPVGLAQSTRA